MLMRLALPASGAKIGVGGLLKPPSLNTRSIKNGLRSLRQVFQLPSPAWQSKIASRLRSIMYISEKFAIPQSVCMHATIAAQLASPSAA